MKASSGATRASKFSSKAQFPLRSFISASASDSSTTASASMSTGVKETDIPKELSDLSDAVKKYGEDANKISHVEVAKLREVVTELAEELKERLDAKSAAIISQSTLASTSETSKKISSGPRSAQSRAGEKAMEQPETDLEGVVRVPSSQTSVEKPAKKSGLLVDRSEMNAMRSRLNKKLSEANTYNRYLLREVQYREDALKDAKSHLVALAGEFKELIELATEVKTGGSGPWMREVDGLEPPALLVSRLENLQGVLLKQLEGIEAMRLREVPLVWYGMAEDVKVMGSFDGWTYGEQMSPESTGTMTRFSTVLKLRPGRYEIKFMVDGEWRVAPEWPSVGHGMTENNILIVE